MLSRGVMSDFYFRKVTSGSDSVENKLERGWGGDMWEIFLRCNQHPLKFDFYVEMLSEI